MLEKIKEFFRRKKEAAWKKVEKIAEHIYWKTYKKKVLGKNFFGMIIKDEYALEQIILWTRGVDPIAKFVIALKGLGIVSLYPIEVISCIEELEEGCKLRLRIQFEKEEWKVWITKSALFETMELEDGDITKKICYNGSYWDFYRYESASSYGMKIEYGNSNIKIRNFLGEKEDCEIYFSMAYKYENQTFLLPFQLDCEISKTIEQEIHNYLQEVDISQIKMCKIYKIMEKCISKFYNTEQSSVEMKMRGVSARIKGNNLKEYHGSAVTIEPWKGCTHKVYCNGKGAWIDYQYNEFKIYNVPSKNAQDFIEEAESVISEIESLNF